MAMNIKKKKMDLTAHAKKTVCVFFFPNKAYDPYYNTEQNNK